MFWGGSLHYIPLRKRRVKPSLMQSCCHSCSAVPLSPCPSVLYPSYLWLPVLMSPYPVPLPPVHCDWGCDNTVHLSYCPYIFDELQNFVVVFVLFFSILCIYHKAERTAVSHSHWRDKTAVNILARKRKWIKTKHILTPPESRRSVDRTRSSCLRINDNLLLCEWHAGILTTYHYLPYG